MHITDLSFKQFRNYENLQLGGLSDLVVFCGPNAVGKTNILEGIQLLTAATSFRHPQINQLVKVGSDHARIELAMGDGNRLVQTALSLEPGKRRYQMNGKPKTAQEIRGVLPAVTFIPDDLELAKKSSSVKRTSLDELGMQLTRNYDIVHKDYEKALRYKNRLLKDESSPALVDAINQTLMTVATQLYCYRRALFARMVPVVQQNYQVLSKSGEEFSATYVPSWLRMQERFPHLSAFSKSTAEDLQKDEVMDCLSDALAAYSGEEYRARRSFIGPHNDQITFFLDGKDASSFASQGQQRSIVLAWKLAEVEMVRRSLGINPVLLLDDVMSELDETRRDMLVQAVGDSVQTFVTATDLASFNAELLGRAQVIDLPFSR